MQVSVGTSLVAWSILAFTWQWIIAFIRYNAAAQNPKTWGGLVTQLAIAQLPRRIRWLIPYLPVAQLQKGWLWASSSVIDCPKFEKKCDGLTTRTPSSPAFNGTGTV